MENVVFSYDKRRIIDGVTVQELTAVIEALTKEKTILMIARRANMADLAHTRQYSHDLWAYYTVPAGRACDGRGKSNTVGHG